MTEYIKSPAAVLDYTVNWTDFLQVGETITAHSFVAETGVTLGTPSLTGANHVVFISGGTLHSTYRITSRITTSALRTQEQSFRLRIELT